MSDPIPFRPYTHRHAAGLDTPVYGSTRKRHPTQRLHKIPHTITETSGPRFSPARFPPRWT